MVVTDEKKAAKLEANRARQNAKYEAAMNEGWRRVRKQEETYYIPPVLIEQPFAVLTIPAKQQRDFISGPNLTLSHFYRAYYILLLQKCGN